MKHAMSTLIVFACLCSGAAGADYPPIPRMQAVPLPYDQVSFQRDEQEIARLHHGGGLRRPFIYPVIGPSGRTLTRMGHPHDPYTHSHHNSVWVSHHKVEGVNFWGDHGENLGRIVTHHVVYLTDSDDAAAAKTLNQWVAPAGEVLLEELRRHEARDLGDGRWLLVIDMQFQPPAGRERTTINASPFGVIGVRMNKWLGVRDGGGTIRNSEGQVGEQGPDGVFRKPARWCDYSGRVADGVVEGLTLLDHPANPNHPTAFHVRADGWMGACLTLDGPITIQRGQPLRLRYGLYVHAGMPPLAELDERWKAFAETEVKPLTDERR